jgi:hypothetical protein
VAIGFSTYFGITSAQTLCGIRRIHSRVDRGRVTCGFKAKAPGGRIALHQFDAFRRACRASRYPGAETTFAKDVSEGLPHLATTKNDMQFVRHPASLSICSTNASAKRQPRGPGIQDVEARAVCRRWPMLVLIQPSARIPKDRGLRLRGERKAAVKEYHAALKRGRQ